MFFKDLTGTPEQQAQQEAAWRSLLMALQSDLSPVLTVEQKQQWGWKEATLEVQQFPPSPPSPSERLSPLLFAH